MALLEFNDNELGLMQHSSHTMPKEDYLQGDYSALLQTFNTTAALVKRGEFERTEVDVSQYDNIPFNREELRKQLQEQGRSPTVIEGVMTSHITGWADAERRAAYLDQLFKAQQQVQENFSTAGMLVTGIPMALVDIDMLATGPTFAAGKAFLKGRKSSSLATRVGTHAAVGAAVGAETMLGYEAATGVYHDDSVTNAAVLGMLLNGTLGTFLERSKKQTDLIQQRNAEGKLLTKEEAKIEQIADANKSLGEVTSVIDRIKQTVQSRSTTVKQTKASREADKGRAKFDRRVAHEQLKKIRDVAGATAKATRDLVKKSKVNVSGINKALKGTIKTIEKSEAANKAAAEAAAERKILVKEGGPIKGQVTRLTNQLAALQAKVDTLDPKKIKETAKKLAKAETKLRKHQAKVTRLDTRVAKLETKPKEDIDLLKNTREAQKIELANRQIDFNDLTSKLGREATAHKTASQQFREHKLTPKEEDIVVGGKSEVLQAQLNKYDVDLSPEGIQKLMETQDSLKADIARMGQDDFNLKSLYGIRKERQNEVAKLNRELEDIGKAKDFRQSTTFKRLPAWAQKLIISPVEKLLGSENTMVSGFTSLLHSGTLHHGKINTHNAWNIKVSLDTQLDRMHKSLIHSYKQAVKDGYTGKLTDFESEVALGAFRVTGRMQRDLFTGIDGSVTGKARMEVVKSRLGSVTRQHGSGSKWIDKSVDEYLDYYESIHERGTKLEMEAFTESLGKGYIKRIYSEDKINAMGRDAAIQHLVEAQKAFAIATSSEVTGKALAEFHTKATAAIDATLSKDFKIQQITQPLGFPKKSTETSLKVRSIDAFDDDLMHVLADDVVNTSHLYGINIHGRLALKEKIGADTDEQIEAMLDQLNPTRGELDNLRVLIETVKGTREASKNPYNPFTRAVKMASTYSSAMHTLAFAVPTVTEVASIAKEFGWSRTINNLVGRPRDVYKLYSEGTPMEKNTIELMASYGDAHFMTRASRFDVESNLDSVSKAQQFMDGVVQKEAVYGGLLPVTDMLRMTTTSLSVDFLARMSVSGKISPTDLMRVQDMGFDVQDLQRIRQTLQVGKDGRIGNMDRKTWGKLDEELTYGVQTMLERTILHPNGATLPKFMTNMNEGQMVPRIFMKFMRFPIESYERLLLRGIQEADAKQAMALAGNIAMWTVILSAKDALRDEDKQKYSGTEGVNKLMMDSFLYNSTTALPFAALDIGSGLLTGENLTNDYSYRLGGVVLSDYEKLRELNPRLSIPLANVNIGDAVSNAISDIHGLEEVWKED